jgi:hypothetical protein
LFHSRPGTGSPDKPFFHPRIPSNNGKEADADISNGYREPFSHRAVWKFLLVGYWQRHEGNKNILDKIN